MSEPVSETVAYQGMKLSQLADRVTQLEQIIMKFSNTANANQQKLIQEIMVLKSKLPAELASDDMPTSEISVTMTEPAPAPM